MAPPDFTETRRHVINMKYLSLSSPGGHYLPPKLSN